MSSVAKMTVLMFLSATSLVRADSLVDPTRPASVHGKAVSTALGNRAASRLTGIFRSGDRRVAVFDGRVVKVGDRVADVTIQEILSDSVRIARNGRVELVRLPKQAASVRSEVRKPTRTTGE